MRLLRLTLLAVGLLLAPACLAPPIVLPPPGEFALTCNTDGTVTITGTANPGAYVFALNERTNIGAFAQADMTTGHFTINVPGRAGDAIELWQELDSERSAFADVTACGAGGTADY